MRVTFEKMNVVTGNRAYPVSEEEEGTLEKNTSRYTYKFTTTK